MDAAIVSLAASVTATTSASEINATPHAFPTARAKSVGMTDAEACAANVGGAMSVWVATAKTPHARENVVTVMTPFQAQGSASATKPVLDMETAAMMSAPPVQMTWAITAANPIATGNHVATTDAEVSAEAVPVIAYAYRAIASDACQPARD